MKAPSVHVCPVCHLDLVSDGTLRNHLYKVHSLGGDKTYTCICARIYLSSNDTFACGQRNHEPIKQNINPSKGTSTVNVPSNVKENVDGEFVNWQEDSTDIIDAIRRGMADPYLKEMARAVFDRRDVLNGKQPGSTFRDSKPLPGKDKILVKAGTIKPVPQAFDNRGVFVGLVGKTGDRSSNTALLLGDYYLKADIVGKIIYLPEDIKPVYTKGLRVKVTGVGDRKIRIEWIDLPPKDTQLRKEYDAKPGPGYVVHSALSDILEK